MASDVTVSWPWEGGRRSFAHLWGSGHAQSFPSLLSAGVRRGLSAWTPIPPLKTPWLSALNTWLWWPGRWPARPWSALLEM